MTDVRPVRVLVCGELTPEQRAGLARSEATGRVSIAVSAPGTDVAGLALAALEPEPAEIGLVATDSPGELPPHLIGSVRVLAALGIPELAVVRGSSERVAAAVQPAGQAEEANLTPLRAVAASELEAFLLAAAGRRTSALAEAEPTSADGFGATVVWLAREPLLQGRAYEFALGDERRRATVAPVRYRLDLRSGEHVAATGLARGELGACELELERAVSFAPYRAVPAFGCFLLEDAVNGERVGIGTIEFALRRAANVRWQRVTIDKHARSSRLGQRPTVVWLTGLSGAGKSTIANLVEAELHRRGHHTYLLDGDNIRHGLNADLGFTPADRVENIRRVAEVAKLMSDAGLLTIVSFISPFRAERRMARSLFEHGEFVEVHVDAPLPVLEARDPKGLYAKARRGELRNFTGIDSPYEPPERPEVRIDTSACTPEQAARDVLAILEAAGRLTAPPPP